MEHPITPSPELVEQWRKEPEYTGCNKLVTLVTMTTDRLMQLCEKSAEYGANQDGAFAAGLPIQTWRDAWHWYRSAPHQQLAVDRLYQEIAALPGGAQLLSEHSSWFQQYRSRTRLVKSFMHPQGE